MSEFPSSEYSAEQDCDEEQNPIIFLLRLECVFKPLVRVS